MRRERGPQGQAADEHQQHDAGQPQRHDLHEDGCKHRAFAPEIEVVPEEADPYAQREKRRCAAKRAEAAAMVFEELGFEGGFGKGLWNREIADEAQARIARGRGKEPRRFGRGNVSNMLGDVHDSLTRKRA